MRAGAEAVGVAAPLYNVGRGCHRAWDDADLAVLGGGGAFSMNNDALAAMIFDAGEVVVDVDAARPDRSRVVRPVAVKQVKETLYSALQHAPSVLKSEAHRPAHVMQIVVKQAVVRGQIGEMGRVFRLGTRQQLLSLAVVILGDSVSRVARAGVYHEPGCARFRPFAPPQNGFRRRAFRAEGALFLQDMFEWAWRADQC